MTGNKKAPPKKTVAKRKVTKKPAVKKASPKKRVVKKPVVKKTTVAKTAPARTAVEPKAKPTAKRKPKVVDPRLKEIAVKQKKLQAEERKIQAKIKAESKAIAAAEAKVTKAVRGLNSHLKILRDGIKGFGNSMKKAKVHSDTGNAATFLASKITDMGTDIANVAVLKNEVFDLIGGYSEDEDSIEDEEWD